MENNRNIETHCPSCGKFTGTYERCPYCGAEIEKRMSIKIFRYGSLLLAIFGVLFLWLAAKNKEIEELDFTVITPTMNFAFVKVTGTVIGDPRVYFNENGNVNSMNFTIANGKNEVRIMAYSAVAQRIIEARKLPAKGENVELKGSLRIRDEGDSLALYIQAPEHISIEGSGPVKTKNFWEITKEDEGKHFDIKAYIVDIRKNESKAPGSIVISSESGKTTTLTVWNTVIDGMRMMHKDKLVRGAEFEARVTVNVYRDRMQLMLRNSTDLSLTGKFGKDIGISTKIKGEITKDDIGKDVVVSGVVSEIFNINTKNGKVMKKLLFNYGFGEIDIVLYQEVHENFSSDLIEGTKLDISGTVKEYNGKLQIIPSKSEDVRFQGVTTVPVKEKFNNIQITDQEITTELLNKYIDVTGKVYSRENLKGNMKYKFIYGDNKQIILFIRKGAVNYMQELEELADGTKVKITGKVSVYKNELEIILEHSKNIQILGE
jgi:DNA/RNA endonuclease YhcR with UshA esterase domain